MTAALLILAALSLGAITDATELIFGKIGDQIYAETDPEHFAMIGQLEDVNGIVSMNGEGLYFLSSQCKSDWEETRKVDRSVLRSYNKIRGAFLSEKRGPQESPKSYTWSDSLSREKREFSAVRLDPETIAYSSEYFPETLAKVIISGDVVTFVHYGGKVRIKTLKCLFINERILIQGIQRLDPDWKKTLFTSTGDKVLKKYLKHQGFNETPYGSFELEQDFSKTRTPQEWAAMERGVRGGGVRAFDGWGS